MVRCRVHLSPTYTRYTPLCYTPLPCCSRCHLLSLVAVPDRVPMLLPADHLRNLPEAAAGSSEEQSVLQDHLYLQAARARPCQAVRAKRAPTHFSLSTIRRRPLLLPLSLLSPSVPFAQRWRRHAQRARSKPRFRVLHCNAGASSSTRASFHARRAVPFRAASSAARRLAATSSAATARSRAARRAAPRRAAPRRASPRVNHFLSPHLPPASPLTLPPRLC